jgi:pimeloyl-ACP methyl ester carboxylesterase
VSQPRPTPTGLPQNGLQQAGVQLPGGRPRLAVHRGGGPGRAFVLVHGLASNARLWDGVAGPLLRAGHPVVAVDLRGHGLSDQPVDGYDTDTCADDLAALIDVLGLDHPVVAGQSWGGNVVLSLAARHPGRVGGVCCVDGGWIRLSDRFASFEECWAVLEPPSLDDLRYTDVADRIRQALAGWPPAGIEGTLANLVELPGGVVAARLRREHHRAIVRSLYEGDPTAWYPRIAVPVLLCPATGPEPGASADTEGTDEAAAQRAAATRAAVGQALRALPDARVSWYPGAHHDLHAEQPDRLAVDLLDLAGRVDLGAGATTTEDAS